MPTSWIDESQVFLDMPSVVDKEECYFKHKNVVDCWSSCIDVCPVGKNQQPK